MLSLHNLSKTYGLHPILSDVTFSINAGDRVGLIGPNGSGKTTLLQLLHGQVKPDEGHISKSPADLRVGYLAQGFDVKDDLTVDQLLHEEIGDPDLLEAELARLADALANEPEQPELQVAYDRVLTKLNRHDIGRIQPILEALELSKIDGNQRAETLSGGQKTRLALALILVQRPQLLLLDEPTNHLDIQMLRWLEGWLREFPGGALIVSHDRTFLDRTVTQILDLDPDTRTVRQYAGNYSAYLDQYLSEKEKQLAAYKDQVYEIRRMRQDIQRTMEQARWVERTTTPGQPGVRRIAKKVARKGKSREKRLERYITSEERVEKPGRSWQMKLDLDDVPHLGRHVLTLEDLAVGYPGYPPLLRHLNLQVQAKQRIVLTGPNGSGKSTLIRTIIGRMPPMVGRARLGASVKLGYMAQEQETLESNLTPLETIRRAAEMNQTEARAFLHFFLFSGDDPLRSNWQLSYGERARLALAVLVAQGCNFLLLDEPINHLDIPSRERFEQALVSFEGTVLAVVHDRYFISRFATDLWLVEDQKLRLEILRR